MEETIYQHTLCNMYHASSRSPYSTPCVINLSVWREPSVTYPTVSARSIPLEWYFTSLADCLAMWLIWKASPLMLWPQTVQPAPNLFETSCHFFSSLVRNHTISPIFYGVYRSIRFPPSGKYQPHVLVHTMSTLRYNESTTNIAVPSSLIESWPI